MADKQTAGAAPTAWRVMTAMFSLLSARTTGSGTFAGGKNFAAIAVQHSCLLVLGLAACSGPDGTVLLPHTVGVCSQWSESVMIGTSRSDELRDVVVDGRGHVYVAGYEGGVTGITNIEPSGDAVGIVLEYGPRGERLARHVIDTSGTDIVEALALDRRSGEMYFAGRTSGALPGFANMGQFDLFVGWLGPEGMPPFVTQFGNERPQHPRRIALGLADELVVAGFDDIYVPTNYVERWENPLLAKFARSAHGGVAAVWQRDVNTNVIDTFEGLAVSRASDGAIYVTGRVDSGPDRGMFVAKIDRDGNELWHRRQTAIGYDVGAALATLPDGHVLLAGSTFAQLGPVAFGQQDAVVRKLDANTGEALWTVQVGSTQTDFVTDMAVDSHGRIYLVGETLGIIAPSETNQGGVDAFLIKLDADGQTRFARQWGSEAGDHPTAVAVDDCERAFIVGYTGADLVAPSNGLRDGFLIPVATSMEQTVE